MGRFIFKLPDVGEGTAEAEIVAWHVKPGDKIEEDQRVVDVMTDKATVEMTSPVAGTVLSVEGRAPGEMQPVGSTLVILEVEGAGNEKASDAKPAPAKPAQVQPAKEAPKAGPQIKPTPAKTIEEPAFAARAPGAAPLAAPAVRQRAHELGITLQYVPGTGPAGRISHEDLDRYIASRGQSARTAGPSAHMPREGVEEIKVIGLRRRIAEKMQEAKRRIPHFGYVEEVDMTELDELRQYLNATYPGRPRLTVLPFVIRAVANALPHHPEVNATFDDEAGIIHRHAALHAGIATQTPNGLMVPVVRHAEARDLWDCAAEIARLAAAAREAKATREELTGSTLTITSLGPMGGVSSSPVINLPEVAIISPNKIVERPVVRGGQIVVRKMMNLSSAFDHRVVDGHGGAMFIQKIKASLEHPATLFIA